MTKWFQQNRNLQLNDIALIVEDMQQRSKWVLGGVVKTFSDKSGVVRTVSVKTPSSVITRPIAKLCLTLEFDKCNMSYTLLPFIKALKD